MTPKRPSEHDQPMAEAARKQKKKRRRRLVLKIAGAGAVLSIVFVLYAGSRHAFAHLWLPIAQKFAPGDLQIDSGSFTITGKAAFEGIAFTDETGAMTARVARVTVRVAPLSFIFGAVPRIKEVTVENPELVLRQGIDAPDEPEPEEEADDVEEPAGTLIEMLPFPEVLIPAAIESVRVTGLKVTLEREGSRELVIDQTSLQVTGIEPGSVGKILFESAIAIAPDDPARRRSGFSKFEFRIDQSVGDAKVSWSGEGMTRLSLAAAAEGAPPPGEIEFDLALEGDWAAGDHLKNAFTITSGPGRGAAGRIVSGLDWSHPDRGAKLVATLEIDSLSPDFLNPLLAPFTPAAFQSSDIDASYTVTLEGDALEFESTFDATAMSLIAAPGESATPPVDLHLVQAGRFDNARQRAELRSLEAHVDQASKRLVDVTLDEPIVLDFDDAAGDALGDARSRLSVHLEGIAIDDLRPWTAVVGSTALDALLAGTIGGDIGIEVAGVGAEIAITGAVVLSEFTLDRGETAAPLGPIEIVNEFHLAVTGLNAVALERRSTRVLLGGTQIAEASIEGGYDVAAGKADLKIEFRASNLKHVLESLEIALPEILGQVEPGAIQGEVTIARADAQSAIVVGGAAALTGFSLTDAEGATLGRSFATAWKIQTDAAISEVRIEDFSVTLTDASGADAGRVTLQGAWPIPAEGADPSREGRLVLAVRGLDTAPYVNHLKLLGDRQLGEALFVSDLTVTGDAAFERIALEGQHELGPVLLDTGDPAPLEISLTVETALEKLGEEIRGLDIAITGQRGDATDRMTLTGSGTLGERPNFQIHGVIETFDATPYAALVTPPADPDEAAEATPAPTPAPAPATEADPAPAEPIALPLDLDAVFEIKDLTWKQIRLTETRATVTIAGDELQAKLERMNLNGGQITGEATFIAAGLEPTVTWNVTADAIPAAPFVASVATALDGQIEGLMHLESSGSGRGMGDALLQSLDAGVGFEFTDGRFGPLGILDKIADETKVELFRRMKFDSFRGGLEIAEGRAGLQDVRVLAPVVQLVAEGSAGLDGTLDLAIFPRVGPEITAGLGDNKYTALLVRATDGFMTFPLAVTAKGPPDGIKYGIKVDAMAPVENLTGAVRDAFGGLLDAGRSLIGRGQPTPTPDPAATPAPPGATPAPTPAGAVGRIENEVQGLINLGRGLLGGNRATPTATPAATPTPGAAPPTPTPAPTATPAPTPSGNAPTPSPSPVGAVGRIENEVQGLLNRGLGLLGGRRSTPTPTPMPTATPSPTPTSTPPPVPVPGSSLL